MTPEERAATAKLLLSLPTTSARMELPDYGFGPMTPSTQQGIPNDTLSEGPPTMA